MPLRPPPDHVGIKIKAPMTPPVSVWAHLAKGNSSFLLIIGSTVQWLTLFKKKGSPPQHSKVICFPITGINYSMFNSPGWWGIGLRCETSFHISFRIGQNISRVIFPNLSNFLGVWIKNPRIPQPTGPFDKNSDSWSRRTWKLQWLENTALAIYSYSFLNIVCHPLQQYHITVLKNSAFSLSISKNIFYPFSYLNKALNLIAPQIPFHVR